MRRAAPSRRDPLHPAERGALHRDAERDGQRFCSSVIRRCSKPSAGARRSARWPSGMRVVGDDGGPERFRQALDARAGRRARDLDTVLAPVALFASIISAGASDIGDMFAGTYVIQERVPRRRTCRRIFCCRATAAGGLGSAGFRSPGCRTRRRRRQQLPPPFRELSPQARDDLGAQTGNSAAAQVSPPPPRRDSADRIPGGGARASGASATRPDSLRGSPPALPPATTPQLRQPGPLGRRWPPR